MVWALFLNRFYQKSSPDTTLIRTGAGGRKVVIDGGCLVLPFLHRAQKVNMRAVPVLVQLVGNRSAITMDRMRVDLEMEFLVRIDPRPQGVVVAAQALGSRVARSEEVSAFIEGQLVDAIQSVAAAGTMDSLHEDRQAFASAVREISVPALAAVGLVLEAASLRRVDQAPFSSFEENNAFNAVGMRRLSEVIADNRKQRVQTEAEADVTVRQSQLEQTRRRLEIDRQQHQYEVEMRQHSEQLDAEAESKIARMKAVAEGEAAAARIEREQSTKAAEIERDQLLRQREMDALLELETRKIDHAIQVAAKRAEETGAQAKAEAARAGVVEAMEGVQTRKDLAVAERARELALLKAREEAAIEHERVQSQVGSVVALAQAESDADNIRAEAEKTRWRVESEGKRALIQAENETSDALMSMKLRMHQLDKMPEIVSQMMKPVEKIDSIRINHVGGLGRPEGAGGQASPMSQAMESILGMAVQLPVMKGIGQEIGLDFDASLAGRVAESANRSRPAHGAGGGKAGDTAPADNDQSK